MLALNQRLRYSNLYPDEMENLTGDFKMKWSCKLQALWVLKTRGFISRASEAKYLCYSHGDHVFGLSCGDVVAVDNLLSKVVRVNGVAQ